MEGPHGELGSRLADGLGATTPTPRPWDFLPGGQVHAVAHLAHAVPEAAGQGLRTHTDSIPAFSIFSAVSTEMHSPFDAITVPVAGSAMSSRAVRP